MRKSVCLTHKVKFAALTPQASFISSTLFIIYLFFNDRNVFVVLISFL